MYRFFRAGWILKGLMYPNTNYTVKTTFFKLSVINPNSEGEVIRKGEKVAES